jgi:kynurenine formamidase
VTDWFVEAAGQRFRVLAEQAIDLSIPLDFAGAQPRFFGAARAQAHPLEAGSFIGDVNAGGSCDCAVLTLIPHCNGTHTECVAHVVAESISVATVVPLAPMLGRVASVRPIPLRDSVDIVTARHAPDDDVIDAATIAAACADAPFESIPALVLRTLPNPQAKRTRDWSATRAPYLTPAALRWLAAQHVRHLVVDLPSLDRADDGGRLAAHRAWWGLPEGSTRAADATRADCTVTELAYVPDSVGDGLYVVSLQVAPFVLDAAPSRPVLFPLAPDI